MRLGQVSGIVGAHSSSFLIYFSLSSQMIQIVIVDMLLSCSNIRWLFRGWENSFLARRFLSGAVGYFVRSEH